MNLEELTAISPLDGRYRRRVQALAPIVSEFGLMRYRVRVEVEWFLHLAKLDAAPELPPANAAQQDALRTLWQCFDVADARAIRAIEARTNHDVKAVEYFVKDAARRIDGLAAHVEFVHFGCTSEDINNLAYALMLREARQSALAPAMNRLVAALREFALPLADVPMLSRTHGQAATPTTVGKEIANTVARLERQRDAVLRTELRGKMNGAVGNYNAHAVAYPNVDWPRVAREFVAGLGLGFNASTTQIEPHDDLAELFHCIARFNQVLLDFDRDAWGYVSLGYFKQRQVAGETGSSTMPHKVNPIDFENSEGNLGLANAVLGHLASKLAVSRWQRDLSDSTALRSIGTAFAYSLVAYDSACRGIAKLAVDRERLSADLDGAWEVLAEAVQTVMRAAGSAEPYERLKTLTRGQRLDATVYRKLLAQLELTETDRRKLDGLTPAAYIGLAERLARDVLAEESAEAHVSEVAWETHATALMAVRRAVFIEEQGVAEEEELDGEDASARHFLAEDDRGKPIGTARLLASGQIGRMAVLPEWRGREVGARLLDQAVAAAREDGLDVFLHAQTHALGFYERNGFKASGDVFLEADIEHRRMTLA